DRRADRQRARRGRRGVHRLRRRLEVPVVGHLHAPGGRDREPGLDRLVVTTRRVLLATGSAALLAGRGATKYRGDPSAPLIARQLRAEQAVAAAYAGLHGREVG